MLRAFRKEEHRLTEKITEWKRISFRPTVRPRVRQEDYVKHQLKVINFHGRSKLMLGMNGQ